MDVPGSMKRRFPGPLYSIGQTVLAQGITGLGSTLEFIQNKYEHFTILSLLGLRTLTDDLSVSVVLPVILDHTVMQTTARGLGDFNITAEYAFVNKYKKNWNAQITGLVTAFFPTSRFKSFLNNTGTGTYGLFIGGTASNWAEPWYGFGSGGITFYKKHNNLTFGDIALYEWGFGRTVTRSQHSHLSIICEWNGIYTQPFKMNGIINRDSGNNVIYFGPELRWRYYNMLLQAAIQYPLAQTFYGVQDNRYDYRCAISLIFAF